jgi:hypothetical protein
MADPADYAFHRMRHDRKVRMIGGTRDLREST